MGEYIISSSVINTNASYRTVPHTLRKIIPMAKSEASLRAEKHTRWPESLEAGKEELALEKRQTINRRIETLHCQYDEQT